MLSFIAAVPFFYIILKELNETKKIIRYSVLFALSFYLSVYIWFLWMYPMEQIGVTPTQSLLIVIVAWIIFPVHQTFCFMIIPAGLKLAGVKKIGDLNILITPVLCAGLYVTAEWVQSWFFTGLTWGKLAVSQYRDLFFIQSMSVFGTYFPAFIIIFINSAIALYLLKYKLKNANGLIFACIILYFANSYFGFFRLYFYNNDYEKITAQIVQGNISSYEKWEERGVTNAVNIFKELTDEYNNPGIDICVWPETAVARTIFPGGGLYNQLNDIAADNDITLFTGAFYSEIIDGEQKNYNAIMAFDGGDNFIKPYAKQHLVPFGEYLPLENILTDLVPFIANIARFESQLTPGGSSGIMQIDGINYGGLVCFDSIFPELARKSVKDGADILIIVTNDSWFRDSSAIYQHNAQAVLRAVSNNRYIVRSANTGISSFVSSTGEILQQTQVYERTVITQEVGLAKSMTIYTRFGDIILYLSWLFIIFCVILRFKTAKLGGFTKKT